MTKNYEIDNDYVRYTNGNKLLLKWTTNNDNLQGLQARKLIH